MARITWMPQAIKDMDTILSYIEIDSGYFARITIQKIFSAVEQLTKFPQMGRIVSEKNDPNLREILYRNYRIVYKYSNDEIFILTVFHSSFQSGLTKI
ncbi:MAG: type II toxin-antitoxin system RelE/ParE family toxin [Promethearchaeota archaeon]